MFWFLDYAPDERNEYMSHAKGAFWRHCLVFGLYNNTGALVHYTQPDHIQYNVTQSSNLANVCSDIVEVYKVFRLSNSTSSHDFGARSTSHILFATSEHSS